MSALEDTLAWHLQAAGVATPEREYQFVPARRWRFDFAWPAARWACEVEGGTWTGGRHTHGAGFAADCAKYNEATILGWRILRVTADQIESGRALDWIVKALSSAC